MKLRSCVLSQRYELELGLTCASPVHNPVLVQVLDTEQDLGGKETNFVLREWSARGDSDGR